MALHVAIPKRARTRALAAVLGAVFVTLYCSAAAVAATTVDDWVPVNDGGEWGEPTITEFTAAELGSCLSGRRKEWSAGGEWVGLVIWHCPDAQSAAAVVSSTIRGLKDSLSSAGEPVFGPDRDLFLILKNGQNDRYWSQGGTYIGIGARCVHRDCEAATARYAEELAAFSSTGVNELWSGTLEPFVLVAAYSPAAAPGEVWVLTHDTVLFPAGLRVPDCTASIERTWVSSNGNESMMSVMDCESTDRAFQAFSSIWSGTPLRTDLGGAVGVGIDSAAFFGPEEGPVIGRAWVQGASYMYVQRPCAVADDEVCVAGSAEDAAALARVAPGEPVVDVRVMTQAGSLLLFLSGIPLLTIVVLATARRIVMRRRQTGYAVAPADASFTAVDRVVRHARTERAARRTIVLVGTVVAWIAGLLAFTGTGDVLVFGLWFFFAPFVLGAVLSGVLAIFWRPGPLHRVARGPQGWPTPQSIAGAILRVAAHAIAMLAVVLYVLTTLLYVMLGQSQTPAVTEAQIEAGLASGMPIPWLFAGLTSVSVAVGAIGGFPLIFAVLVLGPLPISYFVDRWGRRLRQRSLQAVLAQDTRPHFLYLRGFEEDSLRLDASLARRSVIEALTPFGRPRFEEVLVRYLSRFGPVIAISARSQRVPEIGAAKMSFSGDEWQDRVRQWVDGARAVVVAATPAEVRRGLEWEIAQLAESREPPRILLVVAPWPREELTRRWQGFLERAAAWPLFAPLAARPFPSGVEILTWTVEDGWRGYGARRRWDWSYAASILAGVEAAAPAWDRQRTGEATAVQPETAAGILQDGA